MNARQFNKMVALNTLSANRSIMHSIEEKGRKTVLWFTLKSECEAIIKKYPSLK